MSAGHNNGLSEADVQRALDWLRDNEMEGARAKAEVVFCEEFKKAIKAEAMALSESRTVSERENEAYCSQQWKEHCERYRKAVHDYELYRARSKRAELTIDAWRTAESSRRSVRL